MRPRTSVTPETPSSGLGGGDTCSDMLLLDRIAHVIYRRCPGAHLVESSLWIAIASFLAAFDIKKPVDDQGKVVEPSIVFDNPLIRYDASSVHVFLRRS